MPTFYLISPKLNTTTDWQAAPYASVAPALIHSGEYAGWYAVNSAIFDTDACFEKFRAVLEALPQVDLEREAFINPQIAYEKNSL